MRISPKQSPRRGATLVESAAVYSVMFFLLFAILLGGMLDFQYAQVSYLSREAARWASVRGSSFERETNQPSATAADIRAKVLAGAVGLDPARLTVEVTFIDQASGLPGDWDSSTKAPSGFPDLGSQVTNRVRVTVRYDWPPGWFFTDLIILGSTSEVPMSF